MVKCSLSASHRHKRFCPSVGTTTAYAKRLLLLTLNHSLTTQKQGRFTSVKTPSLPVYFITTFAWIPSSPWCTPYRGKNVKTKQIMPRSPHSTPALMRTRARYEKVLSKNRCLLGRPPKRTRLRRHSSSFPPSLCERTPGVDARLSMHAGE